MSRELSLPGGAVGTSGSGINIFLTPERRKSHEFLDILFETVRALTSQNRRRVPFSNHALGAMKEYMDDSFPLTVYWTLPFCLLL